MRVPFQGKKVYVPLGGEWQGWDEERVERERALVSALVQRGEWVPPRPIEPPAPAPREEPAPTFVVFASAWLDARRKRLTSENSVTDLEWRLGAAVAHIGDLPLDQISEATIDDMVTALLTERHEIERARAAGKPLIETYTDARTKKKHQRRARGLSNGSINKVVASVRMVLDDARRRRLIVANPVDRHSMVRVKPAPRSFLQIAQCLTLLEAAAALEAENRGLRWEDVEAIRASTEPHTRLAARYGVSDTLIRKIRRKQIWTAGPERNRNDLPRRAPLALLIGTGIRISELCGLTGEHVDLTAGRISITRDITKTDAGVRTIPMLPLVSDALAAHRAACPRSPREPVFLTRDGTPQTPDNLRRNVVEPSLKRANGLLTAKDAPAIAHCTPHSLRRTFASLLAEIGVQPRRAMYLLGHTDAKLTMSVYQQVLDVGETSDKALTELLGCALDEAAKQLSGRSRAVV